MTWLALHLEVIAEFGALAQGGDVDNAWEEHAAAAREYFRLRAQEVARWRLAQGKCVVEGCPNTRGVSQRCERHREIDRRGKADLKQQRIDWGLCVRCGEKAEPGKRLCRRQLDEAAKRQRERYELQRGV